MNLDYLPNRITSPDIPEGHVQGIAVDTERGFVYYSFTTLLLKTDLTGRPLGSVVRLAGHLGCITFCPEDGNVYGSLEQKHDAIGAGIIRRTGWDPSCEDAFYLVRFDTDKITRMDMDAEKDGVMTAVYLRDVVRDYRETDEASGKPHRYGCSGIDGLGYGPAFSAPADSSKKFMVCYGVYGDTSREDNDCQVISQYDPTVFAAFAKPLNQSLPHHSGPDHYEERYFFYTGNTVYGVQNLEYEPSRRQWLVAVYRGQKETFTNFRWRSRPTAPGVGRPEGRNGTGIAAGSRRTSRKSRAFRLGVPLWSDRDRRFGRRNSVFFAGWLPSGRENVLHHAGAL